MGALEQMLIDLNTDQARYLCSFCYELAISGTTLSLMDCHDVVRYYNIDSEDVLERVIIQKRLMLNCLDH